LLVLPVAATFSSGEIARELQRCVARRESWNRLFESCSTQPSVSLLSSLILDERRGYFGVLWHRKTFVTTACLLLWVGE
jgi:hypothetical protein